jgi:hypothetical protein
VEDKLYVIDSTTHSLGEHHQLLRRGASRSSNLPSTGNSSLAKNAGLWIYAALSIKEQFKQGNLTKFHIAQFAVHSVPCSANAPRALLPRTSIMNQSTTTINQ